MHTKETLNREIGLNIRKLRTFKGLTQQALAQRVGVSYQQIQKYETGHSRIAVDVLFSVANALDVVVDELLPKGVDQAAKVAQGKMSSRETLGLIKGYYGLPEEVRKSVRKVILSYKAS